MKRCLAVAIALSIAAPALAQEPVGCDKFKWPLDRERALLAAATPAPSARSIPQALGKAAAIALVPLADAALPAPPSRAPKTAGTLAGYVRAPALAKPGTYRVTLSALAWIDVIQDGKSLKSTAFTSASGCAGVAKSVKFDFAAAPFVVEISGASDRTIAFVVTPD